MSKSWLSSLGSVDERLAFILDTMREMSRLQDPQKVVKAYSARMRQIMRTEAMVSLSRRDLPAPQYRITRSSKWEQEVNPWKDQQGLPLFDRGLLGELLYADTATIINDLKVPRDDPAFEYLADFGSLAAIPLFDQGVAMNMVVVMRRERNTFNPEFMPEHVWMGNLFGRSTQTLVLSEQLRKAYEAVDREMKAVADIQRSLLPAQVPSIPTLDLAAHYQTSQRAGGDYYDFFPLTGGQWGLLIADVSGHGTPAAVLMAITHSIAHLCCDPPSPAARLLASVNRRLARAYTTDTGSFVSAFYGIYDPPTGALHYANAGHPRPRIRRAASGAIEEIDGAAGLPLGIVADEHYVDATVRLHAGDTLVLYTDGITEARDPQGELFGAERLDALLKSTPGSPRQVIDRTLRQVEAFTSRAPSTDDRTLVAAKVSE